MSTDELRAHARKLIGQGVSGPDAAAAVMLADAIVRVDAEAFTRPLSVVIEHRPAADRRIAEYDHGTQRYTVFAPDIYRSVSASCLDIIRRDDYPDFDGARLQPSLRQRLFGIAFHEVRHRHQKSGTPPLWCPRSRTADAVQAAALKIACGHCQWVIMHYRMGMDSAGARYFEYELDAMVIEFLAMHALASGRKQSIASLVRLAPGGVV